jgi:hypothetical protein
MIGDIFAFKMMPIPANTQYASRALYHRRTADEDEYEIVIGLL